MIPHDLIDEKEFFEKNKGKTFILLAVEGYRTACDNPNCKDSGCSTLHAAVTEAANFDVPDALTAAKMFRAMMIAVEHLRDGFRKRFGNQFIHDLTLASMNDQTEVRDAKASGTPGGYSQGTAPPNAKNPDQSPPGQTKTGRPDEPPPGYYKNN